MYFSVNVTMCCVTSCLQGHLCCAATGVLQLYTGKVTSTRSKSYKSRYLCRYSKSLEVSNKLAKCRLMRRASALLNRAICTPFLPELVKVRADSLYPGRLATG